MISIVKGCNGMPLYSSGSTKSSQSAGTFNSVLQSVVNNKNLDSIFKEASEKYNIPAEVLKAVAEVESGFDSKAVSSCGAAGIMQLMPQTAKSLGVSNVYDAEQNINGGAKYLSNLLKEYNGNLDLALAAYNAGPGSVEKYNGVPPYQETRNYIEKVKSILGNKDISSLQSAQNGMQINMQTNLSALDGIDMDHYLAYLRLDMLNKLL